MNRYVQRDQIRESMQLGEVGYFAATSTRFNSFWDTNLHNTIDLIRCIRKKSRWSKDWMKVGKLDRRWNATRRSAPDIGSTERQRDVLCCARSGHLPRAEPTSRPVRCRHASQTCAHDTDGDRSSDEAQCRDAEIAPYADGQRRRVECDVSRTRSPWGIRPSDQARTRTCR